MGLKCQTFNFDLSAPRVYKDDTWRKCEYSTSIEWLYPVYLKLRKELMDIQDENAGLNSQRDFVSRKAYSIRSAIEVALIQGDIQELHAEIVKGINFINEQKK